MTRPTTTHERATLALRTIKRYFDMRNGRTDSYHGYGYCNSHEFASLFEEGDAEAVIEDGVKAMKKYPAWAMIIERAYEADGTMPIVWIDEARKILDPTNIGHCAKCKEEHHLIDGLCFHCRPRSRARLPMFAR